MLQNLVSTEGTFCKSENDSRHCSPFKLIHSTEKIVNSMTLARCWEWTIGDVSEWLEDHVKLPQYKSTMENNFINGRRLCLLEAHKLLKMGINDFSHVKIIMGAIRALSNTEREKFGRSISLPIKYPLTLYLEYRVPTGPVREGTTRTDFFKKYSIIDNDKECLNRDKLQNTRNEEEFPIIRFGAVKRKSVYTRIEFSRSIAAENVNRKFIDFLIQLYL